MKGIFMTLEKEYQHFYHNIEQLLSMSEAIVDTKAQQDLMTLKYSIQKDVFSVVVLGEFSRGKSTFINALLGKSLLPMDVLPETALVQTLIYAKEPSMEIVYQDGTVKSAELSETYLKQFSAQQKEENRKNIKSIRIGYPSEFFNNQVMFVDTPGVSDLDEQRAEITYGFLPQADMVVFLLDATSPLKKTEKEFIEKRVLPQGIQQIIFIVNKYDNLDEEELEENYLERLKKRIANAFEKVNDKQGIENVILFPLSARQALVAAEKQGHINDDLKNISNYIQEIALKQRKEIKLKRFTWQYRHILNRIYNNILVQKELHSSDLNKLKEVQKKITQVQDNMEMYEKKISSYVEKQLENILALTDKSIKHFHRRLDDDIREMIYEYRGLDFKEFVEIRITQRVQREIDNWLGVYGPHVQQLIRKIELEMSHGISRQFEEEIRIESRQNNFTRKSNNSMELIVKDISNTDVQAGAITALGAIGLTVLAGSIFMPLVSFAAMPLIRSRLLKKRLENAKEDAIPQMAEQINQCVIELQNLLHKEITKRCKLVSDNMSYAYKDLLERYQAKINHQMELNKKNDCKITNLVIDDEKILEQLRSFML